VEVFKSSGVEERVGLSVPPLSSLFFFVIRGTAVTRQNYGIRDFFKLVIHSYIFCRTDISCFIIKMKLLNSWHCFNDTKCRPI